VSAADFMRDLAEAERPGILVGGGAYKAREAICAFAEAHGIPIFRTWNALDVVTDDSNAYGGTVGTYGGPGRNFGIQNTDLLLILGCRISGRITGGNPQTFARGAKRYWVDVDADLLKEHEVKPHVAVHADAADFIGECSGMKAPDFSAWLGTCRRWVYLYDPVAAIDVTKEFHHYAFMRELSRRIPSNAIIVSDTGGNQIMMGHCWQSKYGQRIFSSNGNTPMGFAMCGAIGAWFAEPERPVICIIGDGGMQLNIQELQTIRHYRIPVKVFVINNRVLGNTLAYQRVNGKQIVACDKESGYSTPIFQTVSRAYGVHAVSISRYEEMYVSDLALSLHEPVVIEVVDPDRCKYEPRVHGWQAPIEECVPYLPRDEFKNNMHIDPVEGWENNK
jgi:acetolactate synthase-1/2/3 large subunit